MSEKETLALLERFLQAWNDHDVDALLACMIDDGVFYGSAGPAPGGSKSEGPAALRKAYASIWETFPDASWTEGHHFAAGDRACSEWTFKGTRSDGTAIVVRGCDVFHIRDGRIAVKDSFRKQVV